MQNFKNARRWKDTRAAAEYLGCSKSLLDSDRITGLHKIPFTRLGKKSFTTRKTWTAILKVGRSSGTGRPRHDRPKDNPGWRAGAGTRNSKEFRTN